MKHLHLLLALTVLLLAACEGEAEPTPTPAGVGRESSATALDAPAVTASVDAAQAGGRHYALPADAGVLNVMEPPYNAKGDGKTDDTAAIQAAIGSVFEDGRYATPRMIYFPEGTYLVSGPLESRLEVGGWSGGWRAGMILVGESRDGTVIKLEDNAEGYGDADKPKWVIATGSESDDHTKPGETTSGGGNRAFRHSIINLTVDVGSGNPGAVGIDYVANNRGAVEWVTIRSSDPEMAGHTGLKMTRNWPGPSMIQGVTIEGFDRGIDVAHFEYGNSYENITLTGQRKVGIQNKQNMLAIHKLVSDNEVPAIRGTDEHGLVVLVDAQLTGGGSDAAAIEGINEFYLRDVETSGYGKAVDSTRSGSKDVLAGSVDFYSTEQYALGVEEPRPMGLEIEPTPLFWTTDFDQWVSPQQFLPEGQTKPEDGDWTEALQKAMDAGKPVVYLPNGAYRISKPVTVPPHVRLIQGFQSSIWAGEGNKEKVDPLLRFTGRGGDGTNIEHMWIEGHVEHDADRPITFRHVDIHGRYENTEAGTGDLFIEDTIGPKPLRVAHPQRVFARQLNIEFGEEPLVENHGGTLWLLGYKTEGEMVCIHQTSGKTEMLGGLIYPLREVPGNTPAFLIEGGEAALSYVMSGPKYPNQVRSTTRDGSQTLKGDDVGWRAAALVDVAAGPEVEPTASVKQEANVTADGGVPFWTADAEGADADAATYTDAAGHTWAAVALGGTNDLDKPANWKPMKFNADARRWEGGDLQDNAPTYAADRTLRGRPSGGKLVGLTFTPASAGTFALTGTAAADTWGPDGPIRVVVSVIDAEGKARSVLDQSFDDRSEITWSDHEALQAVQLAEDERLLLGFASERGGTASLDLAPSDQPTTIEAVKP